MLAGQGLLFLSLLLLACFSVPKRPTSCLDYVYPPGWQSIIAIMSFSLGPGLITWGWRSLWSSFLEITPLLVVKAAVSASSSFLETAKRLRGTSGKKYLSLVVAMTTVVAAMAVAMAMAMADWSMSFFSLGCWGLG